jgi:TetR/AcrR family transcriptional regulator, cholesterol catabolism regulator
LTFVTEIVILVIAMAGRRKTPSKPASSTGAPATPTQVEARPTQVGARPSATPTQVEARPTQVGARPAGEAPATTTQVEARPTQVGARSRDPGRRRRVLDVARGHFARFGFKNTRLDAVAEEAGCAKGALYLEFESKEALLEEVAREVLADAGRRFFLEVVSLPSPLERLRETVRFAFREMEREPLFERLMREDPELRALRPYSQAAEQRELAQQQIGMLYSWVEEGIAKGEIRQDVDTEAVPFLVSVLRAIYPHVSAATGGLFSRERLLDAVVEMFARSLAAPAGGGARGR